MSILGCFGSMVESEVNTISGVNAMLEQQKNVSAVA